MTDMFPDLGDDWRPKLKRLLLDLDARIDSAIFQSGKWARELWERFTEDHGPLPRRRLATLDPAALRRA